MKISKLLIDKFRHLENLEFDFTYPEDFHIAEKRGKPLDKICFIGQSATGKTGLLELIKDQALEIQNIIFNENGFSRTANVKKLQGQITFEYTNKIIQLNSEKLSVNGFEQNEFFGSGGFNNLLNDGEKKSIYYFKASIISDSNIYFFSTNPVELIEKFSSKLESIQISKRNDKLKTQYIIFNENVDESIWLLLLNDFLDYRKKFTQKMSELIHKGFIANPSKLSTEFEKWQLENPNNLIFFAEKINIILKKLNLEIDIINTEYSIPLKIKRNDEIIPFSDSSTGTKQLLLTSLPLYSLNTKESIILIDEPERSLYPDMQMDLMEYYQNLAPEAQFIVATHSPFIAASFEPEERFILYFDEEGKVKVRNGKSPIGDDPNDMLYKDFEINYINKHGQKKYDEYVELKQKIHFEKDEKLKKVYADKLEKLGEEYNF